MSSSQLGPASFRHVVFPPHTPSIEPPLDFSGAESASIRESRHEGDGGDEGKFIAWVLREGGLDSLQYKGETMFRRLPACLRAVRAKNIAEARRAVLRNTDNLLAALSALVIGVTSFYRDPMVFDQFQQGILPMLMAETSPLRVWSVGCSDGAELYTIAMLLAEGGVLGRQRVRLLGTDCRTDAIEHAANGCYDADSVKHLPQRLLSKYMLAEDSRWRVCAALRSVAQWRAADALSAVEPGVWDLIVCRNMAIYLEGAVAARLWRRLAGALRVGGVLMVGKAERPMGIAALMPVAPCFFRKTDERI